MKKILFIIALILSAGIAEAQMFWNNAARFEGGTNSYLAFVNTPSIAIPAHFTIECWVYPLSAGGTTRYLVFKQDGISGATYYTGINSSNRLVVGTSPGINRITSKSTIPLNKWTHVAAVFQSSFKIYINGALDTAGSASNAHATFSADSLFIGKHPSGAGFHGMMDNLRIWETALDGAEISKIMRTTLISPSGYPGMVLNVPFQRLNSTGTVFNLTDLTFQTIGFNRGVTAVDLGGKPSGYLTLNEALDLTEDLSRATVPHNAAVDITGALSLEAWIYMTSFTSGQAVTLLNKGQGLAPNSGYRLFINGNQKVSAGINSSNYEGDFTVPLGKWTHVAFTLTQTGQAAIYANGVLCFTQNIGIQPSANTDSLYIGDKPGGEQFKGYMDEVRVSKFAKTQEQIKEFLYKPIDASNQPAGDNFCFNFDGSAFASTTGLQVCLLRGNAEFSHPGEGDGIPVSPLLRSDGVNFSSGYRIKNSDRSIPALGMMTDDSITVSNGASITDINLYISLNHERPQDLQIVLISPSGDSVTVMNNYISLVPQYSNVTAVFDDQADSSMANGRYLDLGKIKPLSVLNTAFTGENSAGVWRLRIRDNGNNLGGKLNAWGIQVNNAAVGIQTVSNETPADYKLEQNYPNPFNPSTNFEFKIADFGLVKLKVYDIAGREVKMLVNENLKAGIYKVNFDGTGLSSGVYFYKLETGAFTDVKKMILVK